MKAKLIKILVVSAVFAFFSAGVSMAQDWKGDRQNGNKAKVYSHYKQDKKQKFMPTSVSKTYYGHQHFSKQHRCPYCRMVVVYQHRHDPYQPYRHYRSHTGIGFTLSVLDPNVAFSVGVKGR